MDLKPAGRFEWERIIKRLRFRDDHACKAVALILATYADPDGSRVRPGLPRLERVSEYSRPSVRRAISKLRRMGLIEKTESASGKGRKDVFDEYQLTFPDDIFERYGMLDPDERLSTPRDHARALVRRANSVNQGSWVSTPGITDEPWSSHRTVLLRV